MQKFTPFLLWMMLFFLSETWAQVNYESSSTSCKAIEAEFNQQIAWTPSVFDNGNRNIGSINFIKNIDNLGRTIYNPGALAFIENESANDLEVEMNATNTEVVNCQNNAEDDDPPQPYGFSSITPLTPFSIEGGDTQHKPQGKVWTYDGKWWCAISVSDGTKIFRLDGTNWTPALQILNVGGRTDCLVVGNLVHIIVHRIGNSLTSYMVSAEYDPANGTYKRWSKRTSGTPIVFPAGSKTATLAVDGTGRMWMASDGTNEIMVWWSDAPYTAWSAPITIATGVKDDDICAVTKLPGKIGVFWSNQKTGLFGFKTHADGSNPDDWSADEKPASQSAIPGLPRMPDDHASLVVASDGTLYCAVKTGYNDGTNPQLGLLVRRPSGNWDDLYNVATNEGTQSILILSESMNKIKVIYTTRTNGGDIAYRESSMTDIAFGPTKTLISGGGPVYNFASSTHQVYNSEVVILATNIGSSKRQLVSVIAKDDPQSPNVPDQGDHLLAFPNPFPGKTTLSFTLAEAGEYTLSLFDMKGARVSVLKKGWAEARVLNTVNVDCSGLSSGVYIVRLQTARGTILSTKMLHKN
jgi:hypothetical protein